MSQHDCSPAVANAIDKPARQQPSANAGLPRSAWTYWVTDPLVGLYNTTLHHAMRLLSIDTCSNLGAFLSFYSSYIWRESDARARRTWKRLRPEEADPASVDAAMRRLWRSVSRTMAEYSVLDRLWDAGRISVFGLEHMQAARDADRPLLVAAVHLGNWEAVLVTGIRTGFAGAGIYLPLDNRFDMRLAIKVRNRYKGGQIAAGPGALRAALRYLRAKQSPFVIYVDEYIRGRVQAPAFGRPLRNEGNIAYAARLAAKTGAYVVPAYCVRRGESARFEVHFLPPIVFHKTNKHETDAIAGVGRINAAIEPVIRKHLDQWFFLLDYELDS
jgi:KDO2-lipid IV(A) lauroyltransferase